MSEATSVFDGSLRGLDEDIQKIRAILDESTADPYLWSEFFDIAEANFNARVIVKFAEGLRFKLVQDEETLILGIVNDLKRSYFPNVPRTVVASQLGKRVAARAESGNFEEILMEEVELMEKAE
jgi:hypothetical protein